MLPNDAAIFAVTVGSRTRKADSSVAMAMAGSSDAANASNPFLTSGLMEMHAPQWEDAAQILQSVASYHHRWSAGQMLSTPPGEPLQTSMLQQPPVPTVPSHHHGG